MVQNAPSMRELVYRNNYYVTGDSASLFNGYACLCPPGEETPMVPGGPEMRCLYEALICRFYMKRNRPDSAARYFNLSFAKRNSVENYDFKETVYDVYTDYYERRGMPERSLAMMKIRNESRDSIVSLQQPERKLYLENLNSLNAFEAEQRAEARRRLWLGVGVCVAFAALCALVAWRIVRWRKRQIMGRELLLAATEEKERRLLALALQEQESKKMLNYVQESTQKLGREDRVSTSDLSVIERNLRMHMASRSNLESFERIFADIKPDFIRRLRELAPDLSENNIRLCCYLTLGMNNREISNIQNVTPDSLRQARRRLKLKFGLTRDDSLEDFLRHIYNTSANS